MRQPETTLYFVRHGQSVANAGGVTMEHAIIPLSPLGMVQAARVASLLPAKPSHILVSKFVRALQTAQPYCARVGREAEIHPLLHEFSALDPALLEGMTGEGRRPIANAYWQTADPSVRMGLRRKLSWNSAPASPSSSRSYPSFPARALYSVMESGSACCVGNCRSWAPTILTI
jgi:broad specificity phosphatase PhoE